MTGVRASQSLLRPMRAVLRRGAVASLAALPIGAALGYAVAGAPGLVAALLGLGIAVAFFTITVLLALATARLQPQALGVVVLGSWLLKMAALIVLLAFLRNADFYHRPTFFAALLVGTTGYLVLEALVVSRTKVLYVEPDLA